MSRIEGMTVQGVRSFRPLFRESITFNTPLTLIVGYNGSGKTTIIECLKYATTGQLPPNSKNGAAFVFDPQLHTQDLVPGCVVLKFRGLDGAKYVVNRHFKVTLTKTKQRKFQTLETTVREQASNGEKSTSSSRVGDVDSMVPTYLGVAPAILESVIFCHQDDSLWPMSEPSALKKKFDEIFDAQKYTKAIDQLKVVRKKQAEKLRNLQVHHMHNEENKNKGQKNARLCQQLTEEIEEYRQKVEAIETEVTELRQKERESREEANNFLSIMNDLKYNQDQYDFRQNNVEELRESIDMMTEGDDELRRSLEQYEDRLGQLQTDIDQKSSEYRSLQGEINKAEHNLNLKLGEKGRLQSDKDKYERQLQTRVEMIQAAARTHEIRGFEGDLDDDQIRLFNGKIQGIFNSKKKEHEQLQGRVSHEADAANKGISEMENDKNAKTSERAFAKQKKAENDRKVKRFQTEMDSVKCDEVLVDRLESDRISLNDRHQQALDGLASNDWDEKIRVTQKELRELEQQGDDLNSELVNCTRLASELAQLDLRKTEARDREASLNNLTTRWSKMLGEQVRPGWEHGSLEAEFKAELSGKTAALNEKKEACDQLQQKLKQVDYKLSEASKQHQKLADNKTSSETAVLDVLKETAEDPSAISIDAYVDELEDLEANKMELEKDLSLFDHMKSYWTLAQTCLQTKNKCHMCDRAFDEDRAKSKLVAKITKHLNDESKAELEQEFRDVDKKLERLRAVRPKHDAALRLAKELPASEKAIDEAKRERDDVLGKLEEADKHRREASEKLESLQSVSSVVSEITHLFRAITDAKEQIEQLERSQRQSGGSTRTPGEVDEARAICTEETRKVKKRLDNMSADRQRSRDLVSNLELESSKLDGKIAQAKQLMDKKRGLSDEIKALREDNHTQDARISEIDAQLAELQPRIDAARAQRDDALATGRKKAERAAEERDTVARTLNQLKIIEDDIQDYVDRGGESNLTSVERSIQNFQQLLTRLKGEMEELMKRINSLKEELSQGDWNKKNIRDNLKYRENKAALEELAKKIARLESEDAEKDYDRLIAEAKKHEKRISVLTADRSELIGKSRATDNNLHQQIELYDQEYRGAEEKFQKSSIDLQTTKGAIADLATFGDSLDKAIMQFHSIKMEEINRIAGDLWRATYQGTDVDTIAIRSEKDTPTSNSTRRSYNYRVIMVKRDTEMDMRGRCSAGQKVLASIIIRLALAESFGVNCGVIALDEPTTNLDSDNIRSLAQSLHGIIRARQAQANFQLIVITHDEEFLRYMRCSDFCDSFFRVKRDENQCSTITKENITMITE
ncbi:DNA repair protein rad50 [Diaporthe eres]|uniref:DNA repair protein rad50 n=1 Tax=Diaporthe eres TaxID=83184 RepID=A0ABR1P355_DIAER